MDGMGWMMGLAGLLALLVLILAAAALVKYLFPMMAGFWHTTNAQAG